MRQDPTLEELERYSKKIEEIYLTPFVVTKDKRYGLHNIEKKGRYKLYGIERDNQYKLLSSSSYISAVYGSEGGPMDWNLFLVLENIDTKRIAGFQPEALLAGSIENPTYIPKGDVNLALIKFLQIRPMSTNRDVVNFIAEYIGNKEVYMITDESNPTKGWIGTFNFYTQPSLEDAIKLACN